MDLPNEDCAGNPFKPVALELFIEEVPIPAEDGPDCQGRIDKVPDFQTTIRPDNVQQAESQVTMTITMPAGHYYMRFRTVGPNGAWSNLSEQYEQVVPHVAPHKTIVVRVAL